MSKGKDIDSLLAPIADTPIQAYFGDGLHTLGLLNWLLAQTGPADVWVSSYSTSEPFFEWILSAGAERLGSPFCHPT